MKNFKYIFILKQHTPIIHFQNDKDASLRATELKPKLDKFVFDHAKIPDEWRMTYDPKKSSYEALDYKVRIQAKKVGSKKIGDHDKLPFFFGNMGDDYADHPKYLSDTREPLEVSITCFNASLLAFIFEHFAQFLATTNFGTRQSKGYGSFYLDHTSPGYKDISEHLAWFDYSFDSGVTDYNKCMINLELFYKSLRSGINLVNSSKYRMENIDGRDEIVLETGSRFYFKSLLFLYTQRALGRQLDKKTVKEKFFKSEWHKRKLRRREDEKISDQLKIEKEDIGHYVFQKGIKGQKTDHQKVDDPVIFADEHEQKYLFKDLFGLSSLESWGSYGTEISKSNLEISRFKSPLFFKIIKVGNSYRVYFLITKIPKKFRRANFRIESKKDPGHLNLPVYDKFDFKHFFNWIFDPTNFNITTHVRDERMRNPRGEYGVLESIFDQLQNSRHA